MPVSVPGEGHVVVHLGQVSLFLDVFRQIIQPFAGVHQISGKSVLLRPRRIVGRLPVVMIMMIYVDDDDK